VGRQIDELIRVLLFYCIDLTEPTTEVYSTHWLAIARPLATATRGCSAA
jgi:hypothetical protein